MRLTQYITESSIAKDVKEKYDNISLIWKHCQPVIKDISKMSKKQNGDIFLFSGRAGRSYGVDKFYKANVRFNRKPKDTRQMFHDIANDEFENRFGIRARENSLFVAGDPYTASGYGKIYLIFPIGKYSILYSEEVDDFTNWLSSRIWYRDTIIPDPKMYTDKDELERVYTKDIKDVVSTFKETTSVKKIIDLGVEGMLLTESYYAAFQREYFNLILSTIRRYGTKMPSFEEFQDRWEG